MCLYIFVNNVLLIQIYQPLKATKAERRQAVVGNSRGVDELVAMTTIKNNI